MAVLIKVASADSAAVRGNSLWLVGWLMSMADGLVGQCWPGKWGGGSTAGKLKQPKAAESTTKRGSIGSAPRWWYWGDGQKETSLQRPYIRKTTRHGHFQACYLARSFCVLCFVLYSSVLRSSSQLTYSSAVESYLPSATELQKGMAWC